jgi:peptidoglycan/LPS O-acetylase OafA/YrhL
MTRDFRTDIQALRGLAVLLVVFYHAGFGMFKAGYLGVDIFFVISGFLITGLIKEQVQQKRFSIMEFYYRRAKRLLPAAYVVIALTTLAAPFLLSDLDLREFRYQVLGALTFTGNIALWLQSDYFAGSAETKPLLHVWSLAIEEQYYLLLPAYLVLAPKRFWLSGLGLLLITSAGLCIYLASWDPSGAFYLLPTRFWEMAVGSIGALLPATALGDRRVSLLRFPALAALVVIPIAPIGAIHPGIDAAIVCFATLILLLAPTKANLAVTGVARVGDISYSLYLIHWPVLVYVRAAWMGQPPDLAIYAALVVSLVGSWLLYRSVEEPFRRGFIVSRKRLISGLGITSVLLGMAPSVVIAATASDINFKAIRRTNVGLSRACVFRPGSPPTKLPKECRTTEKPKLFVWGDSYAMALVPGLAQSAGEIGLAQVTMSACGPAIGSSPFSSSYPKAHAENCLRFNDSALALLKALPEVEVVVISSTFRSPLISSSRMLVRRGNTLEEQSASPARAIAGLKALVDEVRSLGKRVVVIPPPPVFKVDVGDCLERKAQGRIILGMYSGCRMPVSDHLEIQAKVLDILKNLTMQADVEVLDYYDFLCDRQFCRTEIDGKFLYRDGGHLSYEGSELIVRQTGLVDRIFKAAR